MSVTYGDHRTMVSFKVGEGDRQFVERMHATPCGGGEYLLENSPFYAFDISYKDVVLARQTDDDLVFIRVVRRSGHSTYRVKLPIGRGHDYFLKHWSKLESLGCTFEGSTANPERLYAIDVPPGADVTAVYSELDKWENQGVWVFEEAHFFDPMISQSGRVD